jgi:hypothetical protein
MMVTFRGIVTEEPTNFGFALVDARNLFTGGDRVYGGGNVGEEVSDTDKGNWVQLSRRAS